MKYYYMKLMDSSKIDRTNSLLDSHAVYGALCREGLIERFDVYQRVNLESEHKQSQPTGELVVVDIKLGTKLIGHDGIVHGGILSLMFDEAIGCACECLRRKQDDGIGLPAVTAYLTVDFHSPFSEGSEAVIRVCHNETVGRKMYFSATLESKDGIVVFAEARSLFILVRSSL